MFTELLDFSKVTAVRTIGSSRRRAAEQLWFKVVYEDKDEEEVNVSELKTILLHPESNAKNSSTKNKKSAENEKQMDENTPKHHEREQQNDEKKGQRKIMRSSSHDSSRISFGEINSECVCLCVCV
jgi:hypothetical protein